LFSWSQRWELPKEVGHRIGLDKQRPTVEFSSN
jgi:hypothetical protein